MRMFVVFVCVVVAVLAGWAVPLSAADFYVTTAIDSADWVCDSHCSLREAIQAANADSQTVDTIHLEAERYELTIAGVDELWAATGDLDLRTSMNIIGKGPGRTIIDANGIDRVFNMAWGGIDILIRGVTVTGGWVESQTTYKNGSGICIYAAQSNVNLESCDFHDNEGSASENTYGGAIFAYDTSLAIRDTIIRSNSAMYGGAIYVTGSEADVSIERCALYGNASYSGQGVVDNHWGGVVIFASTVSLNYAPTGSAGIHNQYGTIIVNSSTLSGNTNADVIAEYGYDGLVTLTRSIIEGHCSVGVGSPSAITTAFFNLESPGNTCQLDSLLDMYNVADAGIGSLQWHGGPTPSHLPGPTSPAVDPTFLSQPTCPNPDQRWVSRPWDGEADADAIPECDVGSVERVPGYLYFEGFECGYTTPWSNSVP